MSFNNKRKRFTDNDFYRARRFEYLLNDANNDIKKLIIIKKKLEKEKKDLEQQLTDKNKKIYNLNYELIKLKEYNNILINMNTDDLFKNFCIYYLKGERYISCIIYKYIKEERNKDIDIFNQIKELYELKEKKSKKEDNKPTITNNNNKIYNTAIDTDHWTNNKN